MDARTNPPFMFQKGIVDYFFNWRWWAAPAVFLPLAALLFSFSLPRLSWGMTLGLACAGIFFWTFFEYCMHRFLFHFIGKSDFLVHLHYVVHGMHHAHPTNPVRIIFPPFLSILVGAVLMLIPLAFFSLSVVTAFFAGLVVGYVWYEFMHYAAHHLKFKRFFFKRLKRHHLLHHHHLGSREKNFGVTSSFWDRVFKTHLV